MIGSPDSVSMSNSQIAAMRLLLAASALLVVAIDPTEPDRLVAATYAVLALYVVYGALAYLTALRPSRLRGRLAASVSRLVNGRWAPWMDVAWFVLLISLSTGTNSIFFFGFFFAILVASFRYGFAPGAQVTVASAALFTIVGFVVARGEPDFNLNRFLLRPIYLLLLGYMIAYWGGFEISLRRRLALLGEVSRLSNPRFGIGRTVAWFLEKIRTYYQADTCLLLLRDPATGQYSLYRSSGHQARNPNDVDTTPGETVPEGLSGILLSLPAGRAVAFSRRSSYWPRAFGRRGARSYAYDVETGDRTAEDQDRLRAIASTLDALSLASVPVYSGAEAAGRLYLTSRGPGGRPFSGADLQFLVQAVEQVEPVLQNTRLVDRLASEAALQERQKIARDIHDTIIQPYIGLQMGLSAIYNRMVGLGASAKSANGSTLGVGLPDAILEATRDLEGLLKLTEAGIAELRSYVGGLRSEHEQGTVLAGSLQRFAGKFSEATGIRVLVDAPKNMRINDRLAAELFQMAAEGLSNVRRHTSAREAVVAIRQTEDRVTLSIANPGRNGTGDSPEAGSHAEFVPRSIAGRSAALGGTTRVERTGDDRTIVVVDIPL